MFDKTFDSSIVDANRKAVEDNLEIAYENAASRAERMARDIGILFKDYAKTFGAA